MCLNVVGVKSRERVALQVSSLGEQERVEEMEVLTRLRGESH